MGFVQTLQNILGGQAQRQDYQDFTKRYDQGAPSEGYTNDEVSKRYGEIAPVLPPQDYRRAAEEAFGRMSPQERMEFARSLQDQTKQQGVAVPDVDRNGVDDRFQDPAHWLPTRPRSTSRSQISLAA